MSIVTIGAMLGLALLDMLSPAVVGVTLYLLLARPRRVGLLLGAYLATVAAAYFVLGVLLMLGLSAVIPAIDPTVWRWVQGGIGVALFVGSWFIPTRKSDREPQRARAFTVPAAILLGLSTWLFEFATAVPYFAAVGIMTASGAEPSIWLPVLGGYVVIMILPGIALYLAWFLLRDRMRDRFERWQHKLQGGSRTALSWIVGIAGLLTFLDALPNQITIP